VLKNVILKDIYYLYLYGDASQEESPT
jgi:hypothetical protein